MSYNYYPGSVFECAEENKIDTIVNTVNCKGFMGAGLALEFKLRFPEMYVDYEEKCSKREIKVGSVDLYYSQSTNTKILNFPTKDDWKQPSRIQWIERGLSDFRDSYKSFDIKSIAFPKLGTSNGGLEWNQVKSIMERYLSGIDELEIFVCTDEKVPSGTEGRMLEIVNSLSKDTLKRIGLRANAIDSLKKNVPVKRFFMISKVDGIGVKSYESIHRYCYQIAKDNNPARNSSAHSEQITFDL